MEKPVILLVDDHPAIRRLLSILLAPDYTIVEAANGVEAIRQAQRHQPLAVLLDIMMPGELDGIQVLNYLKKTQTGKAPQVAMITALSEKIQSSGCQALGADAYFEKPFSPLKVRQWLTGVRRMSGQGSV